MNAIRALSSLALVALLSGCAELPLPKPDPVKSGPFFTPANVKTGAKLPAELRRVAVLPAWGGSTLTEETLDRVDGSLQTELSKTNRFETVPLTRDALSRLAGRRTLLSTESLPAGLLERIARETGADAVLFSDITSYSPYPPLIVGLRSKLARISDGEILWAADNVFSAVDGPVANSARRYAREIGDDRGPTDLSHTILQNPSRFAAYVGSATFATLPAR